MLTIPGRRSVSSLKEKDAKKGDVVLNVPANVFSSSNINKLAEIEKDAMKCDSNKAPPKPTGPKPPASITTVSESQNSLPVVKKEEANVQKKEAEAPKPPVTVTAPPKPETKPVEAKPMAKPMAKPIQPTKVQEKKPEEPVSLEASRAALKPVPKPQLKENESALFKSSENIQPSKVKSMIRSDSTDELKQVNPPAKQNPPRRKLIEENPVKQQAPAKQQAPVKKTVPLKQPAPVNVPPQIRQTAVVPPEQDELESMDFVRKPRKQPPVPRQQSLEMVDEKKQQMPIERPDVATPVTPNICIIPSTPAPPDSPDFVRRIGQKPTTPPVPADVAKNEEKKPGWI